MTLLATLWMLALLPWAAAVLWLLWGRRKRIDVPFLDLWKGPVESPAPRRSFQAPPTWIFAALLATILAILAAARPALHTSSRAHPPITIILDRGATMSAPRYLDLIRQAQAPILQAFGPGPADLLLIPDARPQHTTRQDWPALASQSPPTALDTRDSLRTAVADRLASTPGLVLVLTDHPLDLTSPRLILIPPAAAPSNVGLVAIAARQSPIPQIMVRLRNQSAQTRADLVLLSDGQQLSRRSIDLPPSPGQRDYFLDAPGLGKTITIDLLAPDDLLADNRAYLVRQRLWPSIEPRASLPPELQRMIDRYRQLRPSGQGSRRVVLVNAIDALPTNDPAAVFAPASPNSPSTRPATDLQAANHPITAAVQEWPALASLSTPPADPGWTPILTLADQPILAVRQAPVRQVWVGLHDDAWAATPSFVIFWTNVFNWLGEGSEDYAASPVAQLPPDWSPLFPNAQPPNSQPGLWPGIYRRADGALRAVNALDIHIEPPPITDWQGALARLAKEQAPRSAIPLEQLLLILSLAAMGISAIAWRGNHLVHLNEPRQEQGGDHGAQGGTSPSESA